MHPIDAVFPVKVQNGSLQCTGAFEYNMEPGIGAYTFGISETVMFTSVRQTSSLETRSCATFTLCSTLGNGRELVPVNPS